jgi:hypothetical protein
MNSIHPFFEMLTIQKTEVKTTTPPNPWCKNGETECIICGHPATTLTGGADQNCAVCGECDAMLNERLIRRFSPLTKKEAKSVAKKTAAKKTKCVYCKKTAAYQCDQCKNADHGDGGWMCCDCADEHGHEVGSLFLCGGCFDALVIPRVIPFEDESYKWEYDDKGVLCRFDKEAEEWDVMEAHCVDCGHTDDECACGDDAEDCLANNPRCVCCNILLSEDDMNALTEEEVPKCESCLNEKDADDLVCDAPFCPCDSAYVCDPCGRFMCDKHTNLCKCGDYRRV